MSAMHPITGPLSSAELVAESDFQTYGDWLSEQRHFSLYGEPDADELASLVVPMTYCPNVSSLLDDSNWDGLQACLAEADPTGNDYQVCSFSHWATPYKFITVRPGSAAHREAERVMAALADYPVLDDEDFSRREYNAQCEAIADALRPLTIQDDGSDVDTDQLAAAMFSDLWEHDQGALECHGGGCSVERDECEASLERLGYVYCDEDMTWRPVGETEPADDSRPIHAGTEVRVSAHTSKPGEGLTYPIMFGTLLEPCETHGWDVIDVQVDGETVSVYSFDVSAHR